MWVSLCLFVEVVNCTVIKYCTACKKHSKLCMRGAGTETRSATICPSLCTHYAALPAN